MRFADLSALPSRAVFLVLALSALAAGLSAQTTRLELGKTISGDLSGGETRSYSISLEANQYLRAIVTQPIAAVMIELYAQDGRKVLEVDTRNFGKPSLIVWVAEAAGEYRISVNVGEKTADARHYELKLEQLRNAGPDDRKRVDAERSFTQGLSEARRNVYDQAILSYTNALGLDGETKDRERAGDTLDAMGSAYFSVGESEKAIGNYEQALEIEREIKDRGGEGRTLNNLGVAYRFGLSQFDKAIGYYEQALPIFHEIQDRIGEGRILGNLGIAHFGLSQFEQAIGYYERALAIFREEKFRQGEVQALVNLGNAHAALSHYEKALGYYQQTLAIARETKDRRREGWALGNLGVIYQNLSQYEEAISYHEQGLEISREIKDRAAEGGELDGLGDAYQKLSQNGKAIEFYEQALAVDREIKNRDAEVASLSNLGHAYGSLNQYETAIGYFVQALAISREIRAPQREGETLGSLGEAYHALRQFDKAAAYYTQALALSREVKDRRKEADELSGLMDTCQASGQPRLAIFYGKQAVNVIQSIRADIRGLGQESRKSFLDGNKEPYRKLTDVLVSQGRLIEAQQALALLKQQEFFDYAGDKATAEQAARIGMTLEEADWAERYRKAAEAVSDQGTAIADFQDRIKKQPSLAESPDVQRQISELQATLDTGNRTFQQFLGDLKLHFDKVPDASATSIDLKVTEALKTDLVDLKHGAVAIYTLVTPERYVAILVTPNGQKDYQSKIKSVDLNQKILAFREAIEDPHSDPRPLAHELYNILIPEALAEDLRQAKGETLMWSLDGPLRYVPVAALHDGKQYLVEKYRMAVFTPASNAKLKDPPHPKWRAVALGVSEAHTGFSPLPAVADELRGIVREKPGEAGVLEGHRLLDEKFTRAAMDRELKGGYAVVHVASHFQFTPGDDKRSFLLLGDGSRLTLADIKAAGTIFDGVDLLTLSACSTGLGDVKTADGSEVEGFGVLAQREGAKAVVASLWPVADASTGLLMQEFYRIRQSDSALTKIEALRRAQLRLLNGGIKPGGVESDRGVRVAREAERPRDYRHPYYWAPFFLMGNWL